MRDSSLRKALFYGIFLLLPDVAVGEPSTAPGSELTELSLAELIDLKVTSVSKKEEKVSEAAAAIFVITNDDIRRSGVTSIPEALRLAPGINVARVNASTWAITARGFNSVYANKLLVLIDGRSVYTPEFSGVFWDSQDVMLEDVEQIEVIRGPGATLWGANAVNGVINIITKKSRDTQGTMVTAGVGTEERALGGARYGGELGEDTTYRIYAKYNATDEGGRYGEWNGDDSWFGLRSGFRLDSKPTEQDSLTLQGDAHYAEPGISTLTWSHQEPYTVLIQNERQVDGQNIIARWNRSLSNRSTIETQVYYDRVNRKDIVLGQEVNTIDFDLQHRYQFTDWNEVVYGVGYRYYRDDLECSPTLMANPEQRTYDLITWFLQDEIALIPDKLRFILGSKFEMNDFSGFNYQPNARLVYLPAEGHTVWGAVSRAVRTPSRLENDVSLNFYAFEHGGMPALVTGLSNPDLEEEELLAYELGYRVAATRSVFIDATVFYNDYENLTSLSPETPYVDDMLVHLDYPVMVFPLREGNKNKAKTYGAELAADWRIKNWWRMIGSYSFLDIAIDNSDAANDVLTKSRETQSPQNQVLLRSQFDLPRDVEFDMTWRYVDRLKSLGIPDYTTFDLRLGWRPVRNLELSLVGQNLLEDTHREYVSRDYIRTAPETIQRGVYTKLAWNW